MVLLIKVWKPCQASSIPGLEMKNHRTLRDATKLKTGNCRNFSVTHFKPAHSNANGRNHCSKITGQNASPDLEMSSQRCESSTSTEIVMTCIYFMGCTGNRPHTENSWRQATRPHRLRDCPTGWLEINTQIYCGHHTAAFPATTQSPPETPEVPQKTTIAEDASHPTRTYFRK